MKCLLVLAYGNAAAVVGTFEYELVWQGIQVDLFCAIIDGQSWYDIFLSDDVCHIFLGFILIDHLCVLWIVVIKFEPLQLFAESLGTFQIQF